MSMLANLEAIRMGADYAREPWTSPLRVRVRRMDWEALFDPRARVSYEWRGVRTTTHTYVETRHGRTGQMDFGFVHVHQAVVEQGRAPAAAVP